MKKTLLLSAVSVAGAAALVGSMTFAAFNDYEDVLGPNVAAGTIELDQWGTQVPWPIMVSNLAPGDSITFPVVLENEGTLDGTLYGKVQSIIGHEDGCDVNDLDPWQFGDPARVEGVVDPNCALPSGSEGDLVKYLSIELTGPGIASPIDLMSAGPNEFLLTDLAARTHTEYTVTVTFDDVDQPLADVYTISHQNDAQGDSVLITLKFAIVAQSAII